MVWKSFALIAAVVPLVAGIVPQAKAQTAPRISGPAVHENLAVFFVHGPSAPGPAPLTLQEAMEAGKIIVHETGNVNSLSIENIASEEVFIQAGDIVKGGQQDRVLTVSLLVPPRSGRMPIDAYCVEQGRWSARGGEDVKKFASSAKSMPSREAKLAMLAPTRTTPAATVSPPEPARISPSGPQTTQRRVPASIEPRQQSDGGTRQSQVWQSVEQAQRKLSANLGSSVAAPASASSLQLSLESNALAKARAAYIGALEPSGKAAGDVVGYIVVIGGRIEGGDVYTSNALFKKMWPKQLDAAATAAIADKDAKPSSLPDIDAVRAFIANAEAGKPAIATTAGTAQVRETRETDKALLAETRRAAGGFIHRAYLAR